MGYFALFLKEPKDASIEELITNLEANLGLFRVNCQENIYAGFKNYPADYLVTGFCKPVFDELHKRCFEREQERFKND